MLCFIWKKHKKHNCIGKIIIIRAFHTKNINHCAIFFLFLTYYYYYYSSQILLLCFIILHFIDSYSQCKDYLRHVNNFLSTPIQEYIKNYNTKTLNTRNYFYNLEIEIKNDIYYISGEDLTHYQ